MCQAALYKSTEKVKKSKNKTKIERLHDFFVWRGCVIFCSLLTTVTTVPIVTTVTTVATVTTVR